MSYFSETAEEIDKTNALAVEVQVQWSDVAFATALESFVAPYSRVEDGDTIFDLYFVSKMPSPLGVFSGIHGHIKDGKLKFLWMRIRRKFQDKMPDDIQKISDELSGYPDGLNNFFSSLGSHQGSCRSNVEMAFPPKWKSRSKLAPRELPDLPAGFKRNYDTVALIDDAGTEIDFRFSDEGGTQIEVETTMELAIDSKCFENACDVTWSKLQPFVESVESV